MSNTNTTNEPGGVARAGSKRVGDVACAETLYVSFGGPNKEEVKINLSDCIPCKCAEPSAPTSDHLPEPEPAAKKKTRLRLEDCFGEWGSPPIEEDFVSVLDTTDAQPRIPRSWLWGNYPALTEFLLENRDTFLQHSANARSNKSNQYNTDLTIRLIQLADSKGYYFECLDDDEIFGDALPTDVEHLPGFKIVRDRVRKFYLGMRGKERKAAAARDESRPSSPTVHKSDGSEPSTNPTNASIEASTSRKSTRNRRATNPSQYLQETASCTASGCSQHHLNSGWNPSSPEKRGHTTKVVHEKTSEPRSATPTDATDTAIEVNDKAGGRNQSTSTEQVAAEEETNAARVIPRCWNWNDYPFFRTFLSQNRNEYIRHAARCSGTKSQRKYNEDVTRRAIKVAEQNGYRFQCMEDTDENNGVGERAKTGFSFVRERIRGYYRVAITEQNRLRDSEVENNKRPAASSSQSSGLDSSNTPSSDTTTSSGTDAIQGRQPNRSANMMQDIGDEGKQALRDVYRSFESCQGVAVSGTVLANAAQVTGYSAQFILESVRAARQRRQFEPPQSRMCQPYYNQPRPPPPPPPPH